MNERRCSHSTGSTSILTFAGQEEGQAEVNHGMDFSNRDDVLHVDFHRAGTMPDVGRARKMELVYAEVLAALERARDEGLSWVVLTHGQSTSGRGKTSWGPVIRGSPATWDRLVCAGKTPAPIRLGKSRGTPQADRHFQTAQACCAARRRSYNRRLPYVAGPRASAAQRSGRFHRRSAGRRGENESPKKTADPQQGWSLVSCEKSFVAVAGALDKYGSAFRGRCRADCRQCRSSFTAPWR